MNSVETIERPPTARARCDEQGQPPGAATGRARPVERSRVGVAVAWNCGWHAAVIATVHKLGLEAALTDAARAEVERCLEQQAWRT